MRLYQNGTLIATAAGAQFIDTAADDTFGWGLEVHQQVSNRRGFNGGFDAIALSTWDGDFSTFTSAQLTLVPEPGSALALAGLAVPGLVARRRRR